MGDAFREIERVNASINWNVSNCLRFGAGGGNRTLTGRKPHGILSPARLPVSPLRRVCREPLNHPTHANCAARVYLSSRGANTLWRVASGIATVLRDKARYAIKVWGGRGF